MNLITITGTVEQVTTAGVTPSGNVKRNVHLTNGRVFRTAPNSSSSFDAANLREGEPVTLLISSKTSHIHYINYQEATK